MGLLDPPGLSLALANTRYGPIIPQTDVPIVAGAEMSTVTTVQTSAGTARIPYQVIADATDLRLEYPNWYTSATSGDLTPTTGLVLEAGIEYAGTIYKATFGGKTSVTINPGGMAVSDPIGVKVTAGSTVYVRTYTSGIGWYPNHRAWTGVGGSGGWTVTSNLTDAGAAAISDASFAYLLGPAAILGTPLGGRLKTVLAVGDSMVSSTGDYNASHPGVNTVTTMLGGGGFIGRAAMAAGFGYINIGVASDQANAQFLTPGPFRRLQLSRHCRTALVNYGTNDIAASRTLAQVQADLIALWTLLSGKGLRTFQTTILPRTTASTDGWTTTGNQTTWTQESVRVALNGWLRDGAPMSGGAAVAAGTAGASRCGYYSGNTLNGAPSGAAHPLYGAVETADAVESARDSGKWRTPFTTYANRTVNDGVTTAGGGGVTSAAANFTNADLGRAVTVAGAGTAGALYVGVITQIVSSTAAVTQLTTPTAVSGAAVTIYDPATVDGIHPSQLAHQAIAAALPTGQFI